MSLVAWLPLNGDSKNQGIKQYTETINTLEYTSNGKATNKCVNSGRLQYDKNPLGMVGSICFWIYPKSADEGGDGKSQIIFGRNDLGKGERKWSLYLFSHQPSVVPHNTSLHSWGCQKDGSKDPNGDFTLTGVLKESAWNHVCVAHDLDYEYVYINGALKRKIKWNSNGTFTFDIGTPIIYGDFYNDEAIYRLNDFRIYDHCLTQSEVSEIAKGLMLHYSFENPYAEETINIPHSLIEESSEVTFGNDSTGDYVIRNGMTSWSGLTINRISVKPGRYYTWSMEVMSIKDIEYVIDGNMECSNSSHASSNDMHFDIIRGYSHINHKLDGSDTLPKGKLEAYKWTRIYFTVKVKQDCTNPKLFHTFVPYIPSGDSSVKVYYRNSQLEEKPYDTPYTSSKREAGLIRDNSGMGNDGTQVYQREKIPIESITPTSAQNLTDTISNGTHTIKGFNGTTNQCIYFGKIKYNSLYHYVGSTVCYEFDLKVTDMTTVSGQTPKIYLQGTTNLNDGTSTWYDNPIPNDDLYKRINNGKNGTYHICLQKKITLAAGVTNVISYGFGVRFDYIKSGTVIISNVHAYYGSLDTSTLSIIDNSAIGSHSAYFNGKNYINCGLVTPLEIDEMTLSCWVYRDDWSTLPTGGVYGSALISSVNAGGFGFKLERCVQESIEKSINFIIMYKDAGYIEHAKSYGMAIDYTKLSSGWHLITGVATRNRATLYIDGEKVRECVHNLNKPIYNYDTGAKKRNNLLVGAECEVAAKPPTAVGVYIDDVRLYATALSDKDVKALYNVKAKIDNKSNLYCNQLVETKSENMMKPLNEVDLNNDLAKFYSSGTFSYSNGIIKYTISSGNSSYASGFYISNKNYGGPLITGEKYRYDFYVKVSKAGEYLLGEEKLAVTTKTLESGKWYHIIKEGTVKGANQNFIIYNNAKNLAKGDTLEVRDIKIYRLYDTEDYKSKITKKGQYKTFELNETLTNNSNAKIVNKYNARWLQVFHHNTNNNTVWFKNAAEALHCNSTYKFSILDQLEYFRNKDGNFEFLLEYPVELPNKYNRWIQSDNPATTIEVDTSSGSPATGYTAIHVDWTGSLWGGLLKGNYSGKFCFMDGETNHANWHYAIGCYDNTNNTECIEKWRAKMPGPNESPATEVNLYVRIDDNDNFKIYNRNTKANEIIEI